MTIYIIKYIKNKYYLLIYIFNEIIYLKENNLINNMSNLYLNK